MADESPSTVAEMWIFSRPLNSGEKPAQPVLTFSALDIERTGAANLGQLFQYIPAVTSYTTGIGTEATRANIINGLIGRGYLVKKGRAVRASDAAFTLIDAVPSAIADPGTTAVWEQALDMIEAGQMALDTFIEKQSVWVGQLVQQYRGATLSLKLPPAPACPQCGAPMQQRTGKSGAFWSCSRYPDCKGTLPIESPTGRRSAPRKRRAASKAS